VIDPLSGVVTALWDWAKKGLWSKYLALLFTLTVSASVTFLGVTGGLLAVGVSPAIAIGKGMCAMASIIICVVMRSPLTRKMVFDFLTAAVEAEMAAQITEVSGSKKWDLGAVGGQSSDVRPAEPAPDAPQPPPNSTETAGP
jgi:hypothetical protein